MRLKIAFGLVTFLFVSGLALGQAPAQQPYPREVTVTGIPGVIAAGAKWQIVWWGLDNADGIVGTPDGGLLFAQREVNRVRKIDANGQSSIYLEDTKGGGALAINYQGRIIAMMRDKPSVGVLSPERRILTDNFQGEPLKGASDLVVEKKGGLYFTESRRMPTPGVYYLGPDGRMFSFGDGMRANGIALSPDEKTLYAPNADVIVAFDILPDGTGRNRRDFAKLQGQGVAGDGMAVDAEGRIYVTTRVGVQVISPQGQHLGVIPTPRPPLSVAFSGPDKKMLFITGRGAVDSEGKEHPESPAKTIYKISMLAQGVKGRAK